MKLSLNTETYFDMRQELSTDEIKEFVDKIVRENLADKNFYYYYTAEYIRDGHVLDLNYHNIQEYARGSYQSDINIFFITYETLQVSGYKHIPRENFISIFYHALRPASFKTEIPDWTPKGDGLFLPGKLYTPQAVFTLDSIIKNKLPVKFSCYSPPDNKDLEKEFNRYWGHLKNFDKFMTHSQLRHYNRNLDLDYKDVYENKNWHHGGDIWDHELYKSTSFSIVRESSQGNVNEGLTKYVNNQSTVSEKLWRTIWANHPFILVGGGVANTTYLKSLGIDDFSDIHGFSWENYTQGDPHNINTVDQYKIFHVDLVNAVNRLTTVISTNPKLIADRVKSNKLALCNLLRKDIEKFSQIEIDPENNEDLLGTMNLMERVQEYLTTQT